ncbi:hypothetical protein C0J52_07206 [Blattella germanica]|nr:hypothetical protein C0J52_07206 [Blattella germanica]
MMSSRQSTANSSASRRIRQEEALVRRRNAEWDRQQLWNGVTQYFQTWDVLSKKHNELSSPRLYQQSMDLYKKGVEDQKKMQNLEHRRQKLAALLFEESRQYDLEIVRQKFRPSSNRVPLEELKCANFELKRREEENQRREAELKLYHNWRTNHPVIKNAMKEREAQRLAEEEREKEDLQKRKDRDFMLQEHLRQQVQELREKERIAETLKKEEAEAIQQKARLEELLVERKLKLRRRAKEIQDQLAEDMKLLEKLLKMELEEKVHKSKQRESARQEMIRTRDILIQQSRLEKQREKEMEFLFQLLTEVLVTQQRQLEEKLEKNLSEQRQLVMEREELVAKVEQAHAELKEECADYDKKKELFKKTIDLQLADKQKRQLTEARIAELEAEKKKEEAKLEEQKVIQELRKMEAAGYNPTNVARRRMFW